MPYKILISDKIEAVCPDRFKEKGFLVDEKSDLSPTQLADIIGEYHGLVVRSATKVNDSILRRGAAGNLKIVGRAGAGLDNIDVACATELGIRVVNTPGLNANAVAELTISLLVILARNLWPAMASMKAGKWEKKGLVGTEIRGKTLGLLGIGAVGGLVAKKALGMGMRVLAYDPLLPSEQIERLSAIPASFEEVFRQADYLSLHLPQTKETTNIVNLESLSLMKPTAYLINCARGGLIDDDALLTILKEKRLAGVAVDAYRQEPPEPSALLSLPNYVALPHLGASTVEAQLAVAVRVADLLINFLATADGAI
jgi:D-3-phosphoglycerate dehydrogenase